MPTSDVFRVFGLDQSFFTRKVTGYLDHKRIRWTYRRSGGVPPDLAARGFPAASRRWRRRKAS
jgi:hypothetical protein